MIAGLRPALLGAIACILAFAGCATPGPLHVYSLGESGERHVIDTGRDGASVEVPSFLTADEKLTGFTYDPFTDHFFLRLAPGNRLRVVDRPARAIKREFRVDELPINGGGDLAIKPRDGHLFLLHPSEPRVFELTRLGRWIRTFSLEALTRPAIGIAYDTTNDRLLVLEWADMPAPLVAIYDLDGRRVEAFALERSVTGPLAFDSTAREIYALALTPATPRTIVVFDSKGRFRRTMPVEGRFIDVGPRSFIRVF